MTRNRPAGTRLAMELGATAVIMDDGLQNPSSRKDCAIAVVDGATKSQRPAAARRSSARACRRNGRLSMQSW